MGETGAGFVDGLRVGILSLLLLAPVTISAPDASVSGGPNSYRTRRVLPGNNVATAGPEGTEVNLFLGTGLDARLRALGIGRLVIAGMQTEFCVDTTTRAAFAHGYKVVLASDAHSTFDSPALKAADIVAHHNTVLRSFATIAPSAEIRF